MAIFLFILFVIVSCTGCSGEDPFIKYVKENSMPLPWLVDSSNSEDELSYFGQAVGDAQIVALSEVVHNGKESLETSTNLIKYLIQEKGFSIVALESALPESRSVNDYILGKSEASDSLLYAGLDERYRWSEFLSLVQWMREYNLTHQKKVQMVGIDITGFYKSFSYSLTNLRSYLQKADPEYLPWYDDTMQEIIGELNTTSEVFLYYRTEFPIEKRADFNKAILKTISRIDEKKDIYLEKLGKEEYQWCRRTAISLLQAVTFYEEFVYYDKDYGTSYGANGRELAMKENFEWIREINPGEKIVMIDHIYHTRTKVRHFEDYKYIISFGTLLRGMYSDSFYSVGSVYKSAYLGEHMLVDGDLGYLLSQSGNSGFFIDLRPIMSLDRFKDILSTDYIIWEYGDPLTFRLDEFDGYLFYDRITAP